MFTYAKQRLPDDPRNIGTIPGSKKFHFFSDPDIVYTMVYAFKTHYKKFAIIYRKLIIKCKGNPKESPNLTKILDILENIIKYKGNPKQNPQCHQIL